MSKKAVTVVMVNFNSSDFLKLSLFTLEKLTRNKYKVMICDNGSSWLDKKKIKRLVTKYQNAELFFRKQSDMGSTGHGEALNILIDKIDTPYGAIIDADATFLIKNWDEVLINQLDDKVKVIGASPHKNAYKWPLDFPITCIALFDTKTFKSLEVNMRPEILRIGKMGQDVGWEMHEKFLKSGYIGKVLELRNTQEFREGPFGSVICSTYYLEGYDDIFASHFGKGSTLGIAKYRIAKYKELNRFLNFPIINYMASKIIAYQERQKWLAICRQIVEAQLSAYKFQNECYH